MHHTITNKFLILIDVPFLTKTWRKIRGGICFIKGVILSGCENSWIAFFQYLVDVLQRNNLHSLFQDSLVVFLHHIHPQPDKEQ